MSLYIKFKIFTDASYYHEKRQKEKISSSSLKFKGNFVIKDLTS